MASAGQEWMENEMRGVFKTTDGGRSWTQSLKISPKTGGNGLAMDPGDPNTRYAAAWERQSAYVPSGGLTTMLGDDGWER